ncbi:MAG: type II secretion system secretin GspD [Ectothiorhodospiraceae bacterium]|nr:type II secretion system secretin GspD [Ectothiorhodospiraceae bacterium]
MNTDRLLEPVLEQRKLMKYRIARWRIALIAGVLMLWLPLGFAAETAMLNFKGADIRAVISSIAEVTGKNFIVDPRVKGKVTLISNREMSKGEVYKVFLSILEVHGYSAIPSGKAIKIVPDADAKHSAMPFASIQRPGKGDEAVTRVIQVEHVTAAQLVPILRPLVPPQGHLAAYPQSNVLIISDRSANIARLVKIIKRIDQPTSGEIEIVPLENAGASDLVRVLTSLQQQANKKGPKSSRPMLVADERTNSILIGGERSARLQLRAIISHLDTPSETVGDTHVIYLRYAKAKDLVPVLTGVGKTKKVKGKKSNQAASSNQPFDIQADESTNALVITASPTIFRSLQSVIAQLDIRRAQVMVEAIIAEVSSDRAAELGVQWLLDGSGGNNPVGAINFGSGSSSISGIAQGAATAAASGAGGTGAALSAIGSGATVGLGQFTSGSFNFAGLIRALEGDGITNVLSTPNLVTLDNEEAEIFVGQELSIPTGSFSNTGSSSSSVNPFTTFERKQIGIRLKVKPQINEGNTIRLDIEQTVDGIAGGAAGAGDIVTSERSIKTSVLVDDGQMLVLGGLIKDDLVETKQKVPLLGDIPFLGALFRYTTVQKVKTNLMVFLRPTILRTKADSLNLTRSKYNFIRSKQLELNIKGVSLLSNESHPVLPAAREFLELPVPFPEAQSGQDMQSQSTPNAGTVPGTKLSVVMSAYDDADDEF